MDPKDKRLGMNRAISRRDFLNGVGVALGASLSPALATRRLASCKNGRRANGP
jgi:hypothetical protein